MIQSILRLLLVLLFVASTTDSDATPLESIRVNSVLSAGHWVKVSSVPSGIHRISFSALRSMGFPSPEKVKFFGFPPGDLPQDNDLSTATDLVPVNALLTTDSRGGASFLLYLPSPQTWHFESATLDYLPNENSYAMGKTFFYLTDGDFSAQPVPMASANNQMVSGQVNEFDDYQLFALQQYNLLQSGSHWYSSLLLPDGVLSQTFHFPNRVNGASTTVTLSAAARCESSSVLSVYANNIPLGTLNFTPYGSGAEDDYAVQMGQKFTVNGGGDDIIVKMQYQATPTGKCWSDRIWVQSRRQLKLVTSQLEFSDYQSVKIGNVIDFKVSNANSATRIWDITNPLSPVELPVSLSNSQLTFRASTDSLRRFIAFDGNADFPTFNPIGPLPNQNLHGLSAPQLLIITHPDFFSQATRLALWHQNQGMSVAVVSVNQVYEEFSGGHTDPTAIRNFVRTLYRQADPSGKSPLKYLLLFGKGTFDNVHPLSNTNPCYVPSWQSENSLNPVLTALSDDYFGLLDPHEGGGKGVVDLGVGRIPCSSLEQAKGVVDKILSYNLPATLGDWRTVVTFIADDQDNNLHVAASEALANLVNQNYPALATEKIYLDAFPEVMNPSPRYPAVNKAIGDRVKQGALIVNYMGHANEEGLAQEKILTIDEIDRWSNRDRLPVFVTATCEFSRWDMKDKTSAGEHLLFNPVGGGIALFSATRLVYANSNNEINKNFFRYAFERDEHDQPLKMGDVIRLAKQAVGENLNGSKFSLLGDPALPIAYPRYSIKTLEVNDQLANQFADTLKPLSLAKVWGEVQDVKGDKLTNFTGTIIAEVLDKSEKATTLGNGGQTPFQYVVQDNKLFKGEVSVQGGEFTLAFTLPKELNARIGSGLIRYFGNDGQTDALGSYNRLLIGGSKVSSLVDLTGPQLSVALDNLNFHSGDQVSKTPLFLASLSDDSGINISQNGIGHDLTLVLDGNVAEPFVLNDYFQSAKDSYKSGSLAFQLPELKDGIHTLTFKAWDQANNSSVVSIQFYVRSKMVVDRVIVTPNPILIGSVVEFSAICNRYNEKLSYLLEVFTSLGRLVDEQKGELVTDGFKTVPFAWSPGRSTVFWSSGIYYFKLRLTALDGERADYSGQLIITR